MEGVPEDVLFYIFENLHPVELVSLSRVNRRWHKITLYRSLHRSVNFHRQWSISSRCICAYIRKFNHVLEELSLQECYWINPTLLSNALQKCTKLKSLNVTGCNVNETTLCTVLQQNENLTELGCSVSQCRRNSNFKGFKQSLSRLDSLAVQFPLFKDCLARRWNSLYFVDQSYQSATVTDCRQCTSKRLHAQWFSVTECGVQCLETAVEGQGCRLVEDDVVLDPLTMPLDLRNMLHMSVNLAAQQLNNGILQTLVILPCLYQTAVHSRGIIKELLTKPCLKNLDFRALSWLGVDDLTVILNKHSLRYLNLTGMAVDGHMLQVIAVSSPNLEELNLEDCKGCISPIVGLEALASFCPLLAKLNLRGVHYQTPDGMCNELLKNIAKFRNLVSLCICNCAVLSNSHPGLEAKPAVIKQNDVMSRHSLQMKVRVSHVKNAKSKITGLKHKVGTQGCCSSSVVGTFDHLAKCCEKLEEIELMPENLLGSDTFFQGDAYDKKWLGNHVHPGEKKCHVMRCTSDMLFSITHWTCLRRLTLAVQSMQGSLDFLVAVAKNCNNLQFLSLVNFSALSHSGNVAMLQEALSHCHKLKDLRLQQYYFNITESFLLLLGELTHLERICVIAKGGVLKASSWHVVSLFEKCTRLFFLVLLCDVTIKAGKVIRENVKERFELLRPALMVSVMPFHRSSILHSCQSDLVKSIPTVHLQEIVLFKSHVSTTVPK